MTARLVILSNRIPTEAEPSGGLVVALHDCLSRQGGLWIGSADEPVETPGEAPERIGSGAYDRYTFDLSHSEHEDFYLGYANSVLWPLFHRRCDLIDLQPAFSTAYRAVNERVARILSGLLRTDDLLWVHDYHFLPVARALRALGVTNRIGFFLHTPFPAKADLPALPERGDFMDWLAAFDLVGLQTERDVASLLELVRSDAGAEFMRDGTIATSRGQFRAGSFPIGIDVEEFEKLAEANAGAAKGVVEPGEALLIGVDRLDYSKGIPNRLEAFGAFLDSRAPDAARATFLQIAPPSRDAIDAYQDLRAEIEATIGALNGRYGEIDWTPLRFVCRNVPRQQLAGLYRRAETALVTPLADGMNLVAKEYVAAQDPSDPGVLILSHFAGAAEQLDGALKINPHDTGEMARAIAASVSMPLRERIERHASMMKTLRERDIHWWTESFLSALEKPPRSMAV